MTHRCEQCDGLHDPELSRCPTDLEYERGYRSGYKQGVRDSQKEVERLRNALTCIGNTADDVSMLQEIKDNRVRREIRAIGTYACEVLAAKPGVRREGNDGR